MALRAAFATAMAGKQVAVVAPTTLLARQHYESFRRRFAGTDVKVARLSRLVSPKEAEAVKQGLADGSIGVVVGTHALAAAGGRRRVGPPPRGGNFCPPLARHPSLPVLAS